MHSNLIVSQNIIIATAAFMGLCGAMFTYRGISKQLHIIKLLSAHKKGLWVGNPQPVNVPSVFPPDRRMIRLRDSLSAIRFAPAETSKIVIDIIQIMILI